MTGSAARKPEPPGLGDDQFHPHAYPAFAMLREQGPVTRGRYYDGTPIWLVTSYEAVKVVLSDRRFSNDPSHQTTLDVASVFGVPPDLRPFFERHLLGVDPPQHTRLRRLIAPAFAAARVAMLRPSIERITDELLDDLSVDDVVELVERFAYPLPIAVISEILGVPPEDQASWHAWATGVVHSEAADPRVQRAEFADSARGMVELARRLVVTKRAQPAEDLASALVEACDDDAQLCEEELIAMIVGLLGAGYRTTSRFIGNGLFALLTHPEQLDLLRRRADLLPKAIDELLRFVTPLEAAPALRFATEDVDVAGVTIRQGDIVQPFLAAADRDPGRFPLAERLAVDRAENRHVAFGYGVHVCPGAALARAEAETAFGRLLARFPDLALAVAPEEIAWHRSFSRGPVRLRVRLRA